ncbi:MAG: hypothetical protein EZS28_016470 [Streblomastix strix]|uniref:Uncharacterized protein n=1 Tax=Streblomastix strix TaxID=222440 RepID=A0A5J4W0F8_9EUKA|nr:MAG: hypothetical protein EZS28_016470 [Streblomastix strix]
MNPKTHSNLNSPPCQPELIRISEEQLEEEGGNEEIAQYLINKGYFKNCCTKELVNYGITDMFDLFYTCSFYTVNGKLYGRCHIQ